MSDWVVGGAFFTKETTNAPRHLCVIVDMTDQGTAVVVSLTTGLMGSGEWVLPQEWSKVSVPCRKGKVSLIPREMQNQLDDHRLLQWTLRAPASVMAKIG